MLTRGKRQGQPDRRLLLCWHLSGRSCCRFLVRSREFFLLDKILFQESVFRPTENMFYSRSIFGDSTYCQYFVIEDFVDQFLNISITGHFGVLLNLKTICQVDGWTCSFNYFNDFWIHQMSRILILRSWDSNYWQSQKCKVSQSNTCIHANFLQTGS